MRNTDRRPRSFGDLGVRLIILVLAALLLLAMQVSGNLGPIMGLATQLTSPAQLSATGITQSVTSTWSSLLSLRTIQQEAAALGVRNLQLQAEINTLQEVEKENEQLRGLLDFAQTRPRLELRGAQIVARAIGEESTNFFGSILIDLGREHGIREGMPVVTAEGLVGRISAVNDATSTVLLLNDTSSSASAILGTSRLNGVVRGSTGGELIMDFIPQGPTFSVGEVVLTSGLNARFPKGIVIGEITSIETQANAVFQKAVVAPSVDYGSLELVLVITNFDVNEALPDFDAGATITDTIQAEGTPILGGGTLTGTGAITGTVPVEGAGGAEDAPVPEPTGANP
jgi:rod shape-determining protein MreC